MLDKELKMFLHDFRQILSSLDRVVTDVSQTYSVTQSIGIRCMSAGRILAALVQHLAVIQCASDLFGRNCTIVGVVLSIYELTGTGVQ